MHRNKTVDGVPEPDFTIGSILHIYSFRLSIGIILTTYSAYFLMKALKERHLKQSTDKLTVAISIVFLISVLVKTLRDAIAQ